MVSFSGEGRCTTWTSVVLVQCQFWFPVEPKAWDMSEVPCVCMGMGLQAVELPISLAFHGTLCRRHSAAPAGGMMAAQTATAQCRLLTASSASPPSC